MTGLIYKDFLALKGHLSTYVVFFVIYGGLCVAGVFSPSVLAGMVVLISIITPMTTVTSDDISRWNRFAVASPACRRGVVAGKYLFTLLMVLLSAVLVAVLLVVLALAGGLGDGPLSEYLLATAEFDGWIRFFDRRNASAAVSSRFLTPALTSLASQPALSMLVTTSLQSELRVMDGAGETKQIMRAMKGFRTKPLGNLLGAAIHPLSGAVACFNARGVVCVYE